VAQIEPVSHRLVEAQLAALAEDLPPAAVKAGMLGNIGNLQLLAQWVDRLRERHPALPLVVDPVLRSTTGTSFADEALLAGYRQSLLPRTTLLTPNREEAAALLGVPPLRSRAEVEQAAQALREAGCAAVVVKGGDAGGESSEDYVCSAHASGWLRLPRIATAHHHGTGCTFASSAAAAMALGFVPVEATVLAKMATAEALRHGYAAGRGAGPVKPRAGFATRIENLPQLSLPRAASGGESAWGPSASFAPLSDRDLSLYAIVDSADWVRRVLQGGVRTVQLRIKDASHPRLREEVRQSVTHARAFGAQLFINDHWGLALQEGAYGVHLGQEDLASADLEAIARAGLRLGLSTHACWEVCRAWTVQPSYIACGPIHPTAAKAMPWIPQGNGNLAYWCGLLPTPVVAIAGMDAERAAQARHCGAAGVALISGITAAADPQAAIVRFRGAIEGGRSQQPRPAVPLPRATLAN
jgi:hydroxymethylpyrimidine kinase/phosphomethylpyrimidine kinase/thiamine-phosphate diphosphorylase